MQFSTKAVMDDVLKYPACRESSLPILACLCFFASNVWSGPLIPSFKVTRFKLVSQFPGGAEILVTKDVPLDKGMDVVTGDLLFDLSSDVGPTTDALGDCNVRLGDEPQPIFVNRHELNRRARAEERSRKWDSSATGRGELHPCVTNHRWCAATFDPAGNSIKSESERIFELLPGEMIPSVTIRAFGFTPNPGAHAESERQPAFFEPRVQNTSLSSAQGVTGPLIYAVDDAPELTELYTILLEDTGYTVRAFNDRARALAALKAEKMEPNLLITDCVGTSMCVDRFMQCCLLIHPNLRILMASGYSRTEVQSFQARPDWFIEKPFTAEEFLTRVRVALAA